MRFGRLDTVRIPQLSRTLNLNHTTSMTNSNQPHEQFKLKQVDTSKVRDEISALEIELEDAKEAVDLALLRIKTLTRTLEEKRASIAPITLASFDILSIIFEWRSLANWRSPLRISGVSRQWHSIVLNTPRAWRFIDMVYVENRLCKIYFDRSKHCGLHVATDRCIGSPFADQVQCLTIIFTPNYKEISRFSQVGRFCYANTDDLLANVTILSTSHFPLLRHLEIHSPIETTDAGLELPPLESLIILIHNDDGWPELLQACRSSLLSLKMTVNDRHDLDPIHIELPNLLYLEIINDAHSEGRISLYLTAPTLKTYIDDNYILWYAKVRFQIPKSITHMRLDRPPLAAGLTQLRVLQADIEELSFSKFCDDIRADPHQYSSLETLEFLRQKGEPIHVEKNMKAVLNKSEWSAFTHLKHPPRLVNAWSAKLPGENAHLVWSVCDLLRIVLTVFSVRKGCTLRKMDSCVDDSVTQQSFQ